MIETMIMDPAEVRLIDQPLLQEMLAFGEVHYPVKDPYRNTLYREWLFFANPHGAAKAVVIRNKGDLIGQAALIPVAFLLPGESTRMGYFVVDVLTHPEFRNMKLFSRIIDAAMEHARAEGGLLLGHPNKAAFRGWQRKSMTFQPSLRPYAAVPALPRSRVISRRDDVLALWPDVERRIAELSKTVELSRSRDYVNWRFYQRPGKTYRVTVQLDRDGKPIAFTAATAWRYGIHLLIDFWTDGRQVVSVPFPTLAMLPVSNRSPANMVPVPVSKEIPYFVTDPKEQGLPFDRITLAASDF